MEKKSDYSLFIIFFFNSLKYDYSLFLRLSLFSIHYFLCSLFTIHYKKGHYSLIIIPHPDPHIKLAIFSIHGLTAYNVPPPFYLVGIFFIIDLDKSTPSYIYFTDFEI